MSEYKSTFKNTVAFGGVQIINVIISILRGKIAAVILGPTGMGINGLYTSTLNLITSMSGMGLELSSIKDLSTSHEEQNQSQVNRHIYIINKLFLICSLIGFIATIVLSKRLSIWTFGTSDYTFSFILLSIFVFLTTFTKAQSSIFRGLRNIPFIIKTGIYSSIANLLITFPILYYFREAGIASSIVVSGLTTFIISIFFYRKLHLTPTKVSNVVFMTQSSSMIKMGFMLVIATIIGALTKMGINVAIGKIGNIADIGFYTSAILITNQFVGFILNSLSADYFPRLTAAVNSPQKMSEVIEEQSEIVLLLATPLLILMIIFSPLLITVFLSSKFLVISEFIRFIALGSFFQVASFCLGYISFAKNDKYYYLLLEGGLSNLLNFSLTVITYYYFGIKGFGYGFLSIYLIYFIIISIVATKRYDYKISKNIINIFMKMFIPLFISFLSLLLYSNWVGYLISIFMFIWVGYDSYKLLDKRGIILILKDKVKKR